jgi:hemoglobin
MMDFSSLEAKYRETANSEIPEGAQRLPCMCRAGVTLQAQEEVRWLEADHDLEFPPIPFPSRQLYHLTGSEMLRNLVRHHHARLLRTELGKLFPEEPRAFFITVEAAADFVVESCGGPEVFTRRHGPMRMRHRHFRAAIDERAREIWLHELYHSFEDVAFPHAAREDYWRWMEPFSIRMINRRTMRSQPARYPYGSAAETLARAIGQEART